MACPCPRGPILGCRQWSSLSHADELVNAGRHPYLKRGPAISHAAQTSSLRATRPVLSTITVTSRGIWDLNFVVTVQT